MSVNRVVVGTLVAAAIGVPSSALAIGTNGPGSKSAPPPAAAAPAVKTPGGSDLSGLAASAGITESQLQSGLIAAKQAGGGNASGVAAFSRATGVSAAAAQRIVAAVFGKQANPGLTSASAVSALASQLDISTAAAQSALEQLNHLAQAQGIDPNSAAFAAIAHRIGVSPTRLAAALPVVKQAMRPDR